MELAINPVDLHAAATALAACSKRLAAAESTFASRARADLPNLGGKSAESIGRGLAISERAVQTIITDIDHLARALAALAEHYPRMDDTAVAPR
jgi:uncharacterized protein YukE